MKKATKQVKVSVRLSEETAKKLVAEGKKNNVKLFLKTSLLGRSLTLPFWIVLELQIIEVLLAITPKRSCERCAWYLAMTFCIQKSKAL